MSYKAKLLLPIIIISQFFCVSLWFAGNSVISEIVKAYDLEPHFLAHLISAVQFGFISGTLVFAVLSIADRFSPSLVFFISSLAAAIFNLGICLHGLNAEGILLFRFLTGFFLAGIYPVGMKIVSDHYQTGLGRSLGFLVGALALGTAFPHFLKSIAVGFPWKYVLYSTSGLAVIGGVSVLLFVPQGPHRKSLSSMKFSAFLMGFRDRNFRSAAFGYFGHMWELYTFWTFLPVMLAAYNSHFAGAKLNVSLLSFSIIAIGFFACVGSGMMSMKWGARKVAAGALVLSCCCCLLSPWLLFVESTVLFVCFLFFWAAVVIADSPMFSTLVAQNAPEESRGSALTIVNCIGFSITILSIQVLNFLADNMDGQYIYLVLAIGPILGLIALLRNSTSIK